MGSGDEVREERNFDLEEWGEREREVREKEREREELFEGGLEIFGLWVLCVDREREVSNVNMRRRVEHVAMLCVSERDPEKIN